MAIYNDSFMDNITSPIELFTGVGTAIGNDYLIGNLILLTFFVLFLILGLRNNFLETLLVDAFITSILAILLFVGGMVALGTIMFPFILLVIILIFMFIN